MLCNALKYHSKQRHFKALERKAKMRFLLSSRRLSAATRLTAGR
jgi:hypothetical protein